MRSIILSAGKSCFVACPGCYNYFAPTLVDTPAILTFAAAYQQRFGLTKITVGGGDPLTRPDLIALLRGLRAMDLSISLDTVGTAFLRDAQIRFMGHGTTPRVDVVTVAELVDVIGIPLDGVTDPVQQLFRRHASVRDQLGILDALDAARARVGLNTVVHSGNTHEIPAIAALLAAHPSVRQWQLFQFMPIGPLGHRNRESYFLDHAAFERVAETALDAAPSSVQVTPKSAGARKNRYLLIDSAGQVWIPDQTGTESWSQSDDNGSRATLGSIKDPDILDRVSACEITMAGANE